MVAADFELSISTGDTSGLDASQHDGTTVHSSWRNLGKSVIMNNERIGKSSDFWNNYEQDIRLAKELGTPIFNLFLCSQPVTWCEAFEILLQRPMYQVTISLCSLQSCPM